jgi:hypothetical protein
MEKGSFCYEDEFSFPSLSFRIFSISARRTRSYANFKRTFYEKNFKKLGRFLNTVKQRKTVKLYEAIVSTENVDTLSASSASSSILILFCKRKSKFERENSKKLARFINHKNFSITKRLCDIFTFTNSNLAFTLP